MQITLLSKKSNSLDKFVPNLTCLKNMFKNHTPTCQTLLNTCETKSTYAEAVKEVDWICNMKQFICIGYSLAKPQVCFYGNEQVITKKHVNRKITRGKPGRGKGTGRSNQLIKLKVYNI